MYLVPTPQLDDSMQPTVFLKQFVVAGRKSEWTMFIKVARTT